MLGSTGKAAAVVGGGEHHATDPIEAMRPEFIYFDLGNVLFAFDRERAFRQMAAVCGGSPEAAEAAVVESGLQEALESGRVDWAAFHAEFSRRTGTAADAAALALAASDMFSLRVEMLPVLAAIERAGCPTGVLSNTCHVHWRHLVEAGYAILPGRFKHHVLSYEVGVMKPHPTIYASATATAGVSADRIFFCDDIPQHVAAARTAGWDAELFTSASALIDQLAARGLTLSL
jgi:putative hydrolase of the HAD superfamily